MLQLVLHLILLVIDGVELCNRPWSESFFQKSYYMGLTILPLGMLPMYFLTNTIVIAAIR